MIPTFNRLETVQQVVSAVEEQGRDGLAELVVVDDGSTDGTWQWLAARRWRSPVVLLRQENSGPARARNRGAERASGRLLIFLGDDTVPQPGWLATHLEEHRLASAEGAVAVVGYTSFPADADTPFLRWINELGPQFGYLLIERAGEVPFNFFYTSNISLATDVFAEHGGFREDFPAAAWEDIELAYRATRRGLRLRYQPRARVLHLHRILPRSFCRRQRTSGLSAAIFAELHPELSNFLGVEALPLRWPFAPLAQLLLEAIVSFGEGLPGAVPAMVYERLLRLAYLRGLSEGIRSRGPAGARSPLAREQ